MYFNVTETSTYYSVQRLAKILRVPMSPYLQKISLLHQHKL